MQVNVGKVWRLSIFYMELLREALLTLTRSSNGRSQKFSLQ
ncbi:hypothetical protein I3842_06G029000 [Carya illinoinensis]|uniref:Uncharacterized protein n=1 Tax=Carya illinoinensis TaxID=32201 RepID=A0A922EPY8_CARIL|nr:hypothetical protein I3842_06G029000 [Carya illinoinensis]